MKGYTSYADLTYHIEVNSQALNGADFKAFLDFFQKQETTHRHGILFAPDWHEVTHLAVADNWGIRPKPVG